MDRKRQMLVTVVSALLDNRWRYARTPVEVDVLVDDLLRSHRPHWGAQLYLAERPMDQCADPRTRLIVSVDPDRGVGALSFHDYRPAGGAWDSLTTTPCLGVPALVYDPYGGSCYRPSSVLPVGQVERAMREFLIAGERPVCLGWQLAEVV
ncbi:hypothetical protein LV78_007996 [Actinosynnema pretiosum]|nr:hypothetical protein [Actinosynnema pretiosum]